MNLSEFLADAIADGHADHDQKTVILGLADAAKAIVHIVRRHGLEGDLGSEVGGINADGDHQKALDVKSEELIITHLQNTGAAVLLSEEQDDPVPLNEDGSLIVAVDPLDGSSNIGVNVTVGTIFSVLPSHGNAMDNCLQTGRNQLAAGFFAYGPQTTLILTFAGEGDVACFTLNPNNDEFIRVGGNVTIPASTKEYAVNSAYSNFWFAPMQRWMAATLAGKDGPCGKNYRMRWVGSLVSDAWRIFQRGGVFLYPSDNRKRNQNGRLRLVYEANPIAMLAEKAGARAIDGQQDILDLMPENLHQRVPLFFGASDEVTRMQKEQLQAK